MFVMGHNSPGGDDPGFLALDDEFGEPDRSAGGRGCLIIWRLRVLTLLWSLRAQLKYLDDRIKSRVLAFINRRFLVPRTSY
jgi:hypothetical protein